MCPKRHLIPLYLSVSHPSCDIRNIEKIRQGTLNRFIEKCLLFILVLCLDLSLRTYIVHGFVIKKLSRYMLRSQLYGTFPGQPETK